MKKPAKKTNNKEEDLTTNPREKMFKTLNNGRITAGATLDDILFRCGELQLDINDTCILCASHIDESRLRYELNKPNSSYYTTYRQGVSEGKLKLNIELEYNIGEPKAKDAYKFLMAERRREEVNRKLEELF